MTNASFTADVTPPTGPAPSAPTPAPVSAKEEAVDTVRFLALLAIAVLIFRSFFLSPFNIPSESMQPRLLIGDYLLVNKMAYGYSKYSLPFSVPLIPGRLFPRTPERGDVVVFKAPPKAQDLPADIKVAADRLVLSHLLLADDPAAAAKNTAATPARAGRAARPRAPGQLASVGELAVDQVLVDLRSRAVTVGKVALQAPQIDVARDADQHLMFERWLRQLTGPASATAPKPAPRRRSQRPANPRTATFPGKCGWPS